VQLDYDELPAGAAASLRDSLVGLLLHFARGSRPTRTQLCLALASLAAHLPAGEWGGGGCVQWLAARLSGEPSEAALPCMLELLTVLPQVPAAHTSGRALNLSARKCPIHNKCCVLEVLPMRVPLLGVCYNLAWPRRSMRHTPVDVWAAAVRASSARLLFTS
jgi:hypothetical protein